MGEAHANVHMEILWPVIAGPETYEATLDASGNLTIRLESFSALNIPLQGSNERPLSGLIADAHAGTSIEVIREPMSWVTEEPPQGCYTGFIDAGDFRPLTGVTCSPFGPASGRIVSSTPDQIDGELPWTGDRLQRVSGRGNGGLFGMRGTRARGLRGPMR